MSAFASRCTPGAQLISATRTHLPDARQAVVRNAVVSTLTATIVYSSVLGGGALARGAVASLQRSVTVLRLAAVCDTSSDSPDDTGPMFSG
ncbi:Hypothetical protein, putative, partial [Bodo saltans]